MIRSFLVLTVLGFLVTNAAFADVADPNDPMNQHCFPLYAAGRVTEYSSCLTLSRSSREELNASYAGVATQQNPCQAYAPGTPKRLECMQKRIATTQEIQTFVSSVLRQPLAPATPPLVCTVDTQGREVCSNSAASAPVTVGGVPASSQTIEAFTSYLNAGF